jgi:hypothetical protein
MSKISGLQSRIIKDQFKSTLESKGYVFFERGDYNLNIISVRNDSGRADRFDDSLNVMYKIDGEWVVDTYVITTEPGPKILRRPINEKGTAILVPDQYRGTYKIGRHKTYTALCQHGGRVKVWRDDNRDSEPDYVGPEDEGWYGINIHKHSGPDDRENPGGSSAGCQVFQSTVDFLEFMSTCHQAASKYSNSFTYTLLNEEDLLACHT